MLDYVISTDTGGTFVDAIVVDSEGCVAVGKQASTPQEPARGILAAVGVASENLGLTLTDVLPHCRMFFNGTTVTTNAMIQRLGARTGLLITRGFEDTLMIGRIKARTAGLDEIEVTNYQYAERPAPMVPIELTRGVRERVDFRGKVLCPLDEDDVIAALDSLVAQKIEALAICLLWSFKNPAHEQRIKHIAQNRYPELFITASSDLVPLMREYERANTTAINCFLGPTLDHYLNDIDRSLQVENYRKGFLVMQSVGGLSPAAEIRRTPITTLLSGPVGGVIATQQLGRPDRRGEPHLHRHGRHQLRRGHDRRGRTTKHSHLGDGTQHRHVPGHRHCHSGRGRRQPHMARRRHDVEGRAP